MTFPSGGDDDGSGGAGLVVLSLSLSPVTPVGSDWRLASPLSPSPSVSAVVASTLSSSSK